MDDLFRVYWTYILKDKLKIEKKNSKFLQNVLQGENKPNEAI